MFKHRIRIAFLEHSTAEWSDCSDMVLSDHAYSFTSDGKDYIIPLRNVLQIAVKEENDND